MEDAKLHRAQLDDADLRGADLNNAELIGARLKNADLRGANLYDANLRDANLSGARLQGVTFLTDAQLVTARRLKYARMPNGDCYNGRLNLKLDIAFAQLTNVNTEDGQAMANYYGVSLEDYLDGQKWARENLARLSRWAALEQEEDAEVGDGQHQRELPSTSMSSNTLRPARTIAGGTSKRLSGLQHIVPKRTTTGISSKRRH